MFFCTLALYAALRYCSMLALRTAGYFCHSCILSFGPYTAPSPLVLVVVVGDYLGGLQHCTTHSCYQFEGKGEGKSSKAAFKGIGQCVDVWYSRL